MARSNFTTVAVTTGADPAAGLGNTIISSVSNAAVAINFPEYFTCVATDQGPAGNGQFALPSRYIDAGTTSLNSLPVGANVVENGNLPARVIMVAGGGAGGAGLAASDNTSYAVCGSGGGAGGAIIFNRLYIAPGSTVTSTTSVGGLGQRGSRFSGTLGNSAVGATGSSDATNLTVTIGATQYILAGGGRGRPAGWSGSTVAANATASSVGIDGGSGGGAMKFGTVNLTRANSAGGLNSTDPVAFPPVTRTLAGDYARQGRNGGGVISNINTQISAAAGGGGFMSAGATINLDNGLYQRSDGGQGLGWIQQTATANRQQYSTDLFLISAGGGGGGPAKDAGTTNYQQEPADLSNGGDCVTVDGDVIWNNAGGNGGAGSFAGTVTAAQNGLGRIAANAQVFNRTLSAAAATTVLGLSISNVYTGGHGGGGGGWFAAGTGVGVSNSYSAGSGANGFITIHFRSNLRVNLPGSQGNGNVVIFGTESPANINQSNVGALQIQGGGTISGNLFAAGNIITSNLAPFLTSSTTVNAFPEIGEVFNSKGGTSAGNLQLSVGSVYRFDNTTTPGIRTLNVGPYGAPTYTLTFSGATNQANLKFLGGRDLAATVGGPCNWQRIS